jgi:hypothetical protein
MLPAVNWPINNLFMYQIRKTLSPDIENAQNWSVSIPALGGYWIQLGKSIMPLTDNYCLINASFEHERGATRKEIYRLIDNKGKVYWQKELQGFNICVVDDVKNIAYVLEKNFRTLSIPGYTGYELMLFDFIAGTEKAKYNLIYPVEKLNDIQLQKAETMTWFPAFASFHLESGQAGIRLNALSNAPEELKNLDAHVINLSDFK